MMSQTDAHRVRVPDQTVRDVCVTDECLPGAIQEGGDCFITEIGTWAV